MNYIKKIWDYFFKPDLSKTLRSFDKALADLEKVKAHNDQIVVASRKQIVSAEIRIADATALASRASGIHTNIKNLINM